MRDLRHLLTSHYSNSRALVVGINVYQHGPDLGYAVNDALGFKEALVTLLGFDEQHIQLLTDENATRANILRQYNRLKREDIGVDERVIVFFAGHGSTLDSYRGEIGYLVPHDGDINDESSLIRWDELTRGADRIRAKHVLFIMDACYGGLAVTRNVHAGSTRFLKDMLKRFSRQVLTAGKADETVADANGPIPGHSVFTGHLLKGLQGEAKDQAGYITANGLMNFVYTKVGQDQYSDQTPSYGHIDGDGDLILFGPNLFTLPLEGTVDDELLVEIPYIELPSSEMKLKEKIDTVKALLPDVRSAISLHDLVVGELRRFISKARAEKFAVGSSASQEQVPSRVEMYEEITLDIALIGACIAYWMSPAQSNILQKLFSRTGDQVSGGSGSVAWLALQGYPIILQLYSAGVAVVEAGRYDALRVMFETRTAFGSASIVTGATVVETVSKAILELNQMDVFKLMPGHRNNYTPMSEYLHKLLQPKLDEVFFIGANYERSFDEFEVLFAMAAVDYELEKDSGSWFPIGRFAWKAKRAFGPLKEIAEAISKQQGAWPPLVAGLFGGSVERATRAISAIQQTVGNLRWY